MNAKKNRKSDPVHTPTLDDPTPCKTACATCGLYKSVERIKEMSGRPGTVEILSILRECIKPADWKAIIKKQLELAREGNKGAFESLMEYTVGRPTVMEPPAVKQTGASEFFYSLLIANGESQDEPDPERNPNLRDMPPYVPPKETPRYHYDPDED